MNANKWVCHSLMGLGLIYLVATRYYLYVHAPELHNLDFWRAMGANISYLVIFVLAYWLSSTSRWIVSNSILGLFCVIVSPVVMPLVGYIGLVIMAIVRKFGNNAKPEAVSTS